MLFLFALLIVVLILIYLKNKSEEAETEPPREPAKPYEPFKPFDANDPTEIFKLANALSFLVGNVGNISYVHVVLQDEDAVKHWPKVMSISASIDDWKDKSCRLDTATFEKLGLPYATARYLSSVPFTISHGDTLEYTFTVTPQYLSAYKAGVLEEMRKGVSKSIYVTTGTHKAEIKDCGFLSCFVD